MPLSFFFLRKHQSHHLARVAWRWQEEKLVKQEAQLDEWFRLYDKSETGKMNREEVGALLTAIKREDLGEPDAIVDEKLVDQIISKFDVTKDGEIERTELLPAVKKYRALLRHKGKLEELFKRHDTDHSGRLSPEQLLSLLKELAAEKGLYTPTVDGDVAFILSRCDEDHSGTSAHHHHCRATDCRPNPRRPTCITKSLIVRSTRVCRCTQSRSRSWGRRWPRGGNLPRTCRRRRRNQPCAPSYSWGVRTYMLDVLRRDRENQRCNHDGSMPWS